MAERFKYPPLVELAAELRWASLGLLVSKTPTPTAMTFAASGQYEDFFMRFGSRVGALGYERVERIVPPGFPALPFQAIYRFRKKEPEEGTTIYQVGGGVFTANITPPYHSWEQFRPVVERGVECLLSTRNPAEEHMPFGAVILRYINAFGAKFTQERSAESFVQEVLGFAVDLPRSIRAEMVDGGAPKMNLQLDIPLPGRRMSITLGQGVVGGEESLIMDLTVITEDPVAANVHDIMAAFDTSRGAIHRVFLGVTQKLLQIMQPIEEGSN
jgi:uncharacterized protein (TIGR04255 family)